jgi:hypothetical protein
VTKKQPLGIESCCGHYITSKRIVLVAQWKERMVAVHEAIGSNPIGNVINKMQQLILFLVIFIAMIVMTNTYHHRLNAYCCPGCGARDPNSHADTCSWK